MTTIDRPSPSPDYDRMVNSMNRYEVSLVNATVDRIVADICNRRGLRHEWEMIDEDVVEEIRQHWFVIIAPLASRAAASA